MKREKIVTNFEHLKIIKIHGPSEELKSEHHYQNHHEKELWKDMLHSENI